MTPTPLDTVLGLIATGSLQSKPSPPCCGSGPRFVRNHAYERPYCFDDDRSRLGGRRRRSFVSAGALAVAGTLALTVGSVAVGLLAGGGVSAAATRKPVVLRVMVTNDDGVGAPGIDAAVQALRKLPRTSVAVVAPLTNQSGTGGKTTAGRLVVTKATTASGYPATAVHGYPADTVVWAVKDHGIGRRPDLVVSGINFGENVGPLATVSGTVGAAREAVRLGIPALAASQGVDNGSAPDFAEGATQLVAWVTSHRAALVAHRYRKPPAASLNVPTCPGTVRGPVSVPLASSITGVDLGQVDCTSSTTTFANDAQAFVDGYAALSPLYPASSGG